MSWQTLSQSNLPYGSLAVAVAADANDDDDFDEDHVHHRVTRSSVE